MLTSTPIDQLSARAGTELGVSDDVSISQETVDGFADVTGDHQWIHTDPLRAANSPYGGTVAHGYLTLALAPMLLDQVLPLGGFAMAVNYGLDKLRFPAPLPVGEQVRMRVALDAVDPIPGGAALSLTLTFERAAGGKPVCVANAIYRVYEEDRPHADDNRPDRPR
jgi:acyl dehydratase